MKKKKWKYIFVGLDEDNYLSELNKYGELGWELVDKGDYYNGQRFSTFKRPYYDN